MAQIDPNIALGFRLPQIENPINQFAKAQELNVNALKMQEYQRGIEQENKLRELLAGGADLNAPETIRQMYGISPKMGAEFEKSRAVIQKEKTLGAKGVADLEATYMKNARDTLGVVGDQTTYDNWRQQTISKLPGLANMIPPQYSPQAKMALMADANKYLEQNQISAAQQAQMGVTMRGQNIGAETARRGQDIGRIPVGFRMTADGTLEPIPGGPTTTNLSSKEIQARESKFPQATQAVKTFEAKTTELEKDLIALRDHPGLSSITGIAAGRAPGITAQGRAAEALYDKITARGGFKELQDMRAASPTGGALGNVSNQEGAQLRAAFAAIDRKQDAADVKKAIDTAISDLQGSKGRVREAYDMTYDYKGGGATPSTPPPPPPPPSAGGNTVTIPGGKVLTFPTPEAAAAYRQAAGL
jgi:hypothetical protein